MTLQWTGVILAITTITTIGAGHVLVRKLNYIFGTKPAPFFFSGGIIIAIGSLLTTNNTLSATLGIIAITTLWDGVEILRQEKRVLKGHAPKNPKRFPV